LYRPVFIGLSCRNSGDDAARTLRGFALRHPAGGLRAWPDAIGEQVAEVSAGTGYGMADAVLFPMGDAERVKRTL
jgi:hypothetical protein